MKVAVIGVKRTGEGDPLEFAVIVRVGVGETRHHVTMVRDTCERLTAGTHTPERCIEAACEFLLDCEPKEVAAPVRRLFPRGDQVVPQFEIRPTDYCGHRPAHASKRMPPSMISTRPGQFAFSPKPGTRSAGLQSHWLGRFHCCITRYCRRFLSSRFTEPPSPDRLSRYE